MFIARGAGVLTIDDTGGPPRLLCADCYSEIPFPEGWSIRYGSSRAEDRTGERGTPCSPEKAVESRTTEAGFDVGSALQQPDGGRPRS